MADAEIHEPRRAELLKDLVPSLSVNGKRKISYVVWAFLWLCDISCLEKLTRDSQGLGILMEDIILPWLCKPGIKSTTATPAISLIDSPTGLDDNGPPEKKQKLSIDTSRSIRMPVGTSSAHTYDRGLPLFASTSPATPCSTRDPNLRDMTIRRDQCCILTQIETPIVLEHAHIYPNSLGPAGERQALWGRLRLFWPKEVVDEWHNILGSLAGTEKLVNTMMLDCSVHKAWGSALFAFKHVSTSDDGRTMKLQFYWLPHSDKPKSLLSAEEFLKEPVIPSDITCGPGLLNFFDARTLQPIKSGDIIELTTDTPQNYPLPSEKLINLQWHLHRIAALSAAAIDDVLMRIDDDDSDDDTYHSFEGTF